MKEGSQPKIGKLESIQEESPRVATERKSDTAISPIMNEVLIVSSDSEDEDQVMVVKSDSEGKDTTPADNESTGQSSRHNRAASCDATLSPSIRHQSSPSEDRSSRTISEQSSDSKTTSMSYACQFLHCLDSSDVLFLQVFDCRMFSVFKSSLF